RPPALSPKPTWSARLAALPATSVCSQPARPVPRAHDAGAAAGAVQLWLHDQRHVGVGAGGRRVCVPVLLPHAQGLVADRRRAQPLALGAVIAGALAGVTMLFLSDRSGLKVDVIIGVIFPSFFGLGLFMISLKPMAVNIQTIVMGNVLAITPADTLQLALIGAVCAVILLAKWKDLMVVFFDENHARSIGLRPQRLKMLFFALLAAAIVAAMITVGAFLVIALIVTPGATAYLLCDRFPRLLGTAVVIGVLTSFVGAYASFFLDGATGGIIVSLQSALFL